MSKTPEINVKRRRKGEKPTRRAAAPVRRPSTSGSGARPGGGAPVGSGGGSLLRPSAGKLGCGGFLLLAVFVVDFFWFLAVVVAVWKIWHLTRSR